MKKANAVLATVLAASIGLPGIGLAGAPGPGRIPPAVSKTSCAKRSSLFDDESLTKEQRMRIAALHEKYYRETAALRQKLREAVFAYRQAKILDPRDQKTLQAKYQAVEEARLPLRRKMAEFRIELAKVLTPEQQVKLWEKGGWRGGFGHGGHRLDQSRER